MCIQVLAAVKLTYVPAVGKSHRSLVMNQSDEEKSLHRWLIEAGEGLPGICRLHLSGSNNPNRKQTKKA